MVSSTTFTDTSPGAGVNEYRIIAVIDSLSADASESASATYGASSYTDPDLSSGSLYEYRVRAISGDLSGDWSNIVSGDLTTPSATTISATGDITLPGFTLSATGNVSDNTRSATTDITLPSFTITANGINTTPYIPPDPPSLGSDGEDRASTVIDTAIYLSI